MRFPVLILALVLCQLGFAQRKIEGRVVDARTLEPLPFASAFVNNSTIGVTCDDDGKFVIANIPDGDIQLVFSYVGHESQTYQLTKQSEKEFIEIKLKPLQLKEVEVAANRDVAWEKNLKRFETIFFGAGKNYCKILNPWVLEFTEGADNILHASAVAPLEIENTGLGYIITYHMKDFTVSPDAYNISGNTLFREISSNNIKQLKKWKQERDKAFAMSERNVFRTILRNDAEAAGLYLYEDKSEGLQINRSSAFSEHVKRNLLPLGLEGKATREKDDVYNVIVPARMEVHNTRGLSATKYYQDVSHAVGWIEVKGGRLKVNSRGVVLNPEAMIVSGYFTDGRMGRLLPSDYDPDAEVSIHEPVADYVPLERLYVQTDRDYYYPGETIWFKGYASYNRPWLRDSLSKVAYVDLIYEGNVIWHGKYPLENGMLVGNVKVATSSVPGNYFIRAYTNWMLNFGDDFVFVRSIPVLKLSEFVKESGKIAPSDNGVSVSSSKKVYRPGERIVLHLSAHDSAGVSYADLSVSVTDILRAVPVENISISDTGKFREKVSIGRDVRDPEKGLVLKGQLKDQKNNPVAGDVFFSDENFRGIYSLSTDDNGMFVFDGVHFEDSVRIAANGKTKKNKAAFISMMPDVVKPVSEKLIPLQLDIASSVGRSYNVYLMDTSDIMLLPEVLVERERFVPQRKSQNATHRFADVTVTGDALRKSNSSNLLYALQSMVPGFVVQARMNKGYVEYIVRIGQAPTTFSGSYTSVPLVLIDDMPLALDATALPPYLMSLNINDIDRIEILKFGKGAVYGTRGGNGVIAVYMRKIGEESESRQEPDEKKFQSLTLRGYSKVRAFPQPDYSKPDSNPSGDYRTTVYWNPLVVTDNEGKAELSFYAAGTPTTYRVVAEGMTSTGVPIRGEYFLKVED